MAEVVNLLLRQVSVILGVMGLRVALADPVVLAMPEVEMEVEGQMIMLHQIVQLVYLQVAGVEEEEIIMEIIQMVPVVR